MASKVVIEHLRVKFLQLIRQPSFVISTLVFPSLFFMFFALPNADDPLRANMLLGSFAAFAVLGVVLFQFGVDISLERSTPWAKYLRTLPLRPHQLFLARSLCALIFALVAAWVVMLVIRMETPSTMGLLMFLKLTGVLILGSLPFCLMGLAVGYWVPAGSVLPISNLFYLLLSFGGGLWIPPIALPEKIQKISEYLPTRSYGELAWSVTVGTEFQMRYLWVFVISTLITAVFAFWGYARAQRS